MSKGEFITIEGNEAVAHVAYRVSEVIAIYPITPSSPMGEYSDAWASVQQANIWGVTPTVIEMQSEGGAAGAVHGSLMTGSLTTTFTASQGLLLMIPNMYKIAGELTPLVIHVAARSLAAQGLSIFGDHSDVMATRATGFAMLASESVQAAHDMALISHAATLRARLPILHFFDGFRTSHEIAKIQLISDEDIHALMDDRLIADHRARALNPNRPHIAGTAQNPDVYFQARETVNPFYARFGDILQATMDDFAALVGRQYQLYEYEGDPDAERLIVMMGSGLGATREAVAYLRAQGEKVGVLNVRAFRPFDIRRFAEAIPASVRRIAVLDRTKEPGSAGEPLLMDITYALMEALAEGYGTLTQMPLVIGGRYGLSSKEFTPAMALAVFANLGQDRPKNHFTVGINDDLTHTSLDYDPSFSTESPDVVRALFYGLGSDGTVGANKNSIKIIGENTENYAQGYFVYDSKKSGAITISHLRFGKHEINSSYLVTQANFIACHQPIFLERYDMLQYAMPGAVFLLNTPAPAERAWDTLPRLLQEQIISKQLRFFVIDAYNVASEAGMRGQINTVMQTAFFAISGVLPAEEAISAIKTAIIKTYSKKGDRIVQMNLRAVDSTLAHLHEVAVPAAVSSARELAAPVPASAPDFVRGVLGEMIAQRGDLIPVSALPVDGVYPSGTTQYEKRNLALEIPVWDPQVCIQCGKCAMVCPHAVIRIKSYDPAALEGAPATFKHTTSKDFAGEAYTIQVAPEDCTGCAICVDVCPAKNKSALGFKAINMQPQPELRAPEAENWDFFLSLPEHDRRDLKVGSIRQQQIQRPLFEFSGACSGCGETPYIKLATQLFGDRMVIANATGCSSIYGGNLPTTPYTTDAEGRGPAWANSLFEDNAEFGLGMRTSLDQQMRFAQTLLISLREAVGTDLADALLSAEQRDESDLYEQRQRVAALVTRLEALDSPEARRLLTVADALVRRSVWIVGGDGWAYDIGFGGLDHVIASGANVNILVMDTEVYSNTGGQMSKATPRGAVAKFAAGGKHLGKKDLGLMAMSYGHVYVARVAMGAKDEQTLRAFLEAEAYDGPALIIAYSHCIAHGINMTTAMQNQKLAVETGQWPLYRYNPLRAQQGENPLQLDSRAPRVALKDYLAIENRFNMLTKSDPETARILFEEAQHDVDRRWAYYEYLAARPMHKPSGDA